MKRYATLQKVKQIEILTKFMPLNQAAINIGGMVLNALAIEHYILRYSSDSEYVSNVVLQKLKDPGQ